MFENLNNIFVEYGIFTLVASIIIFVIYEILDKTIKAKKNYLEFLPIVLGILSEVIYGLIVAEINELTNYFYVGIICASLVEIYRAIFMRIKNGKSLTASEILLAVEGIIKGFVSDYDITVIAEKIVKALETENQNDEIYGILENSVIEEKKNSIGNLVTLIVETSKQLHKKTDK